MKRNVSSVVRQGLCTGCGVCSAVCPTEAIKIVFRKNKFQPIVNEQRCINCGLCYAVCGGREPLNIHSELIGKENGVYVVMGKGNYITERTASGGFVTSFLQYLFESKMITGALVVINEGWHPTHTQVVVVRNPEQLSKIGGSIYYPVPLGMGLREIIKVPGKYAIVGLPCHVHSIIKAINTIQILKKRVFLVIGLFDGFMPGWKAFAFLLAHMRISPGEIRSIYFRYKKNGKDGMLVTLKNDKKIFIPVEIYKPLCNGLFSPERCWLCSDMTNEYADISCGDAHHIAPGKSLVIIRSKLAQELFMDATRKGYFIARSVSPSIVEKIQTALWYKRTSIRARIKYSPVRVPISFGGNHPESNVLQHIGVILFNLTRKLESKHWFPRIPTKLLMLYGMFTCKLLIGR